MGSKKRIAVINYNKCQPEGCGNFLCVRVCPVNRTAKDCIVIEELKQKPVISEELCIGCQICSVKCPFSAITIINLAAELSNPIHQYGKNAFRLYGLPYPKESSVTGLIGKNGTGKTTVLKILSQQIIPNLGDIKSKPSIEKLIEFYKGKELSNFFKKAKEGKAKLSYKPQNIEEIPKKLKGKVIELLKKADERNSLKEISEKLELKPLLEHEIGELSTGELQRVAIAAASLREAEYYFFDEPSSFLDVRQRLNAAKAINSIAEKAKSVIVIEHDLALLDYLSDYIYILYGRPAAYGIVSSAKSTLNGINEFLQGFLKNENIRFRDSELKFEVKAAQSSPKKIPFLLYPALKKTFSTFNLSAEAGELKEGEIIGIIGPNGIGKTTFIKMLGGLLEPDNTKVEWKMKISYKAQNLEPQKIKVKELFTQPSIDTELFKSEIEKKLELKELSELKCSELSGGELQKVAIALCLSRQADIFLLDEPSAFIDVEDRIATAEVIRSITEKKKKLAVIVDHDLLFIDAISDRLIVFEGSPSIKGFARAPQEKHEGMNSFLRSMNVSFRRDPMTGRPRANKLNSVKDREQKEKGEYYYTK